MNSAVTGLRPMTLVVSFRPTPSILAENGLDTNKNLVTAWKRFFTYYCKYWNDVNRLWEMCCSPLNVGNGLIEYNNFCVILDIEHRFSQPEKKYKYVPIISQDTGVPNNEHSRRSNKI